MLFLLKIFYHFIFLIFFAMVGTFFIGLGIGLSVPRPNRFLNRLGIIAIIGILILGLVKLGIDYIILFPLSIFLGFSIGFFLPSDLSVRNRIIIFLFFLAFFLLILLPAFLSLMDSGFRGIIF